MRSQRWLDCNKPIKELSKKVLYMFITAMTSLSYVKIEQEDWGISAWSPMEIFRRVLTEV